MGGAARRHALKQRNGRPEAMRVPQRAHVSFQVFDAPGRNENLDAMEALFGLVFPIATLLVGHGLDPLFPTQKVFRIPSGNNPEYRRAERRFEEKQSSASHAR